jgi:hypothetical protein
LIKSGERKHGNAGTPKPKTEKEPEKKEEHISDVEKSVNKIINLALDGQKLPDGMIDHAIETKVKISVEKHNKNKKKSKF